jgi:sugar phosphate isomerase/epimerase
LPRGVEGFEAGAASSSRGTRHDGDRGPQHESDSGARHGSDRAAPIGRIPGSNFKVSLNAYSFNDYLIQGRMTLHDLIDYCARLQFDAIDTTAYYFPGYPGVPDDRYLYELKWRAFVNGLAISGTGIRNDFCSPDPEKRKADVKLIRSWIRAAAKLGAPVIRIFSGRDLPDGFSRSQVLNWMASDIKECVRIGRDHGVLVAVQNHNHFLKNSEQILELLALVDSDWFGLILDIGSLRSGDPYEEVEKLVPYALSWQLKENVYYGEEKMEVDLERLLSIARRAGYRGYLPLETLGEGDPRKMVQQFLIRYREAAVSI